MEKSKLTLGHSPDPDDAFMFYGLAKGLVDNGGYEFEHILQDIQTLNERASRGELDISAISIHAYAHVCDKYALLPSGASMGDGYGPMLVAREDFSKEEIASRRIAVPGTMTSAFLALQLWLEQHKIMTGQYLIIQVILMQILMVVQVELVLEHKLHLKN